MRILQSLGVHRDFGTGRIVPNSWRGDWRALRNAEQSFGPAPVESTGAEVDDQLAAPAELRTPNMHRAKKSLNKECEGWPRGGPARSKKAQREEGKHT